MKEIFVTSPLLPPINEYIEEIKEIWERKILTNNGPEYKKFNQKLKEYLNINSSSLFTNGHLALEMALKSLNIEGEVITTPFTFISTTHAIVNNNLKPVFCDIKLDDYTMDETKIEELITEKTSAIVPVHVYGYPCNVEKIEEIAKTHNLKVIYDAAHAFGVEINNKSIFDYGDLSMCSFHATKIFNTIEGGMVAGQDKELIQKVELLKNYGITSPETIDEIGINGKMSEFQAAMGVVLLNHIDEAIEKRKQITLRYKKAFSRIEGIVTYEEKENIKYNYAYMPILIKEEYGLTRNELYDMLKENGVFSRKYFYPLTNNVGCYYEQYKSPELKNATYVSENILTLPLYPDLTLEEVDFIIDLIRKRGNK